MDPLPSGQTVIGTEHWDLEATGAGSDFEFIFHLPFTPTEPLDSASIFFAPDVDVHDGDENPACSGTFLAPTAPPALLCVYVGATAATDGTIRADADLIDGRAISVEWEASGAFDTYVQLRWAYTAP